MSDLVTEASLTISTCPIQDKKGRNLTVHLDHMNYDTCLAGVPSGCVASGTSSLQLRLFSKIDLVVSTLPQRAVVKIKRKYVNTLAWRPECRGSSMGTYCFMC